jgi:hypothetical protein
MGHLEKILQPGHVTLCACFLHPQQSISNWNGHHQSHGAGDICAEKSAPGKVGLPGKVGFCINNFCGDTW